MKTAVCIGHSRKINGRIDGGAYSPHLKMNERTFNLKVAEEMKRLDSSIVIIDAYEGAGYSSAMRWLADKIKREECDLAIELHFNSAHPDAKGHEWLYWHASKRGEWLAWCFRESFSETFPEIFRRGIKACFADSRGADFLRFTHCPALICEPFFGSNGWDCAVIDKKGHKAVASAYVSALAKYREHADALNATRQ